MSKISQQKDQSVHNAILLNLPDREQKAVFSKMEFVGVAADIVLNEIAEPIQHAYFVNSGFASIQMIMSDGKCVEVGMTGKEGFVGLPLAVGFGTSPTRSAMQSPGTVFRVSAKDVGSLLQQCPQLQKHLHRYSQKL